MPSYQFDNFVQDTTEALSRQSDPRLAVELVSEGLRRLLSGSFFLDEASTRPAAAGFARHELYRGDRFSVVACVFSPQQSTPIHDHAGWGVIAGVSNRLIATTWRRMDDGLTPGFASLDEVNRTLVSESSFACLRAPEETIHRLENPFREAAVTLHVFAGGGEQGCTFDMRDRSVLSHPLPELIGV